MQQGDNGAQPPATADLRPGRDPASRLLRWIFGWTAVLTLLLVGMTAWSLTLGERQVPAVHAVQAGANKAKAAPPQLSGLRQVGLGTHSVTIVWRPVAGGAPYTVYRNGQVIGRTDAPTFTDQGIQGPAQFHYAVSDRFGQRETLIGQVAMPWSQVESGASPSVALVTTYPSYLSLITGQVQGGTGFVVNKACDILTAYHVVRDAHVFIDVTLASGTRVHARLLAKDPALDLALLALPGGTDCGAALSFSSQPPKTGMPVGLLGYPGLGPLAFARGELTAARESVRVTTVGTLQEMAFRGAADAGDSGGPLFNHFGRVIGVVDARSSGDMGYAIPGGEVQAFLAAN